MIGSRSAALRPRTDVVVVGAGVAGLACAGFLASAGRSVVLLEHHSLPGGCCTAFARGRWRFDAAVHHVGACGPRGAVGRLLARLGVELPFRRLDPLDHVVREGREPERIPASAEAWEASLARRYPAEARGLAAFFPALLRLHRNVLLGRGPLLERFAEATFQEFAAAHVGDPELLAALGAQWGYLGSPPGRVAATGMAQMLISYLRYGAWYPAGSTQALANALARAVEELGGQVLLRHGVAEVLVEDGGVAGVRLEDGRTVRAPAVVWTGDPRRLLADALPPECALPERRRLGDMEAAPGLFGLYLAVDGDADLDALPRGFYFPGREVAAVPWLYLSVATRHDPSLARDGAQLLSATVAVDPDAPEYAAWIADRSGLESALLACLGARAPELSGRLLHAESASPRTLTRYTRCLDGAAYGAAVLPGQAARDRLAQETSVGGLLLAGQWTAPGPGVAAVAASGQAAAGLLLENSAPIET